MVHETSDPLTGLVKKIDRQLQDAAGKTPRALGVFVLYENKTDILADQLVAIAEMESLVRVSQCIGAPPDDYEISREAEITVVIYKPGRRGDQQVTANFALRKGELTPAKVDEIVKAFTEILPK
jgi:hypothetical protein